MAGPDLSQFGTPESSKPETQDFSQFGALEGRGGLPRRGFSDISLPPEEPGGMLSGPSEQLGYLGTDLKIGWNTLTKGLLGGKLFEMERGSGEEAILSATAKSRGPDAVAQYQRDRAERLRSVRQRMSDIDRENEGLAAQSRPSYRRMQEINTGEWTLSNLANLGGHLVENPGAAVSIATQSGAPSVAMIAAAVLTRAVGLGPIAAAVAGGTASGVVEFGNDYAAQREQGVDHDEAYKKALVKSGVIGALDALSMKTAGSTLDRVLERGGFLRKAGIVTKELGRQAGLGMAGEAGGTLASGRTPDPLDVLAEGVGEVVFAPGEAMATFRGTREKPAPDTGAGGAIPAGEALGEIAPRRPVPAAPAAPAPIAPPAPDRAAEAVVSDTNTLPEGTPARAVTGAPAPFSTESGVRLDAQYALIEADTLTASHDTTLKPNPAYPEALQPRERSRAASEIQVARIASSLDPERLGASADAATGAPIVGPDGLVESGNARTIALQRLYQTQASTPYRQWLAANAQRFGFNPEQVTGMRQPVLVRMRRTPVNRVEFARQANAPTTAQMAPSELARADAARIGNIDDLILSENGDFAVGRNAPFIRRFMSALPDTERGALVMPSGALSQAGYTRLRNAILARAYGENPALLRMVESLDNNIRGVTGALMRVAPLVARVRDSQRQGAIYDRDITDDVIRAMDELTRLRSEGKSVGEVLAQANMFGELSQETVTLIEFLDRNIKRPSAIAQFIERYLRLVESLGSPQQGTMFEQAIPGRGELISTVTKEVEGESIGGDRGVVQEGAGKGAKAAAVAGEKTRAGGKEPVPGAAEPGRKGGKRPGGAEDRGAGVKPSVKEGKDDRAGEGRVPGGERGGQEPGRAVQDKGGGGAAAEAGGVLQARKGQAGSAAPGAVAGEIKAAAKKRSTKPELTQPSPDRVVRDTKGAANAPEAVSLTEKGERLSQVPGAAAQITLFPEDTASLKRPPQGPVAEPKFIGDLRYSQTLVKKGYGALDDGAQATVLKAVLSWIYDDKVFGSVISTVPIDVVNNLVSPKFSAKDALRDKAVFIHALATNNDLAVRGAAIDAIVRSSAVSIAKVPLIDATRAALNLSPAAEALQQDAHEAATSPLNDKPFPTPDQIAVGNFAKGHLRISGLEISIENPVGSIRTGVDPSGKPWVIQLQAAYGYIRRTEGKDDQQVDVYIADGVSEQQEAVFIVNQQNPATKAFDEHKVVLGVKSKAEAAKLYDAHFSDGSGPSRRASIHYVPMDDFKAWLKDGDTTLPFTRNWRLDAEVVRMGEKKKAGPELSEDVRQIVMAMRSEIGHEERGGRLIIDQEGAARAPNMGDVIGRTAWIGQRWWFDRPDKLDAAGARRAVDKALAWQALGARERRFVDYVVEIAQQRNAEMAEAQQDAEARTAHIGPEWATLTEDQKDEELDRIFGADTRPVLQEAVVRPAEVAATGAREAGQEVPAQAAPEATLTGQRPADLTPAAERARTREAIRGEVRAVVNREREAFGLTPPAGTTTAQPLSEPKNQQALFGGESRGETTTTPTKKMDEPVVGQSRILQTPSGSPIARIKLLTHQGRGMGTYEVEAWLGGDEAMPFGNQTYRQYFEGRTDKRLISSVTRQVTREGAPIGYLQLSSGDVQYLGPEPDKAGVASGRAATAPETRIEDVGENLWYNRRNFTGKALQWSDVQSLNETLKIKEVVKSKVWPRPDYEQLVADGLQPFFARFIKQVYDGIGVTPAGKSDADLQRYIDVVGRVREAVFGWAKDNNANREFLDAVVAHAKPMAQRGPISITSMIGASDAGQMRDVIVSRAWPDRKGDRNVFRDGESLLDIRAIGGRRAAWALQFSLDDTVRALKDIEKGWPRAQEAWQRQGYSVIETAKADFSIFDSTRSGAPIFVVNFVPKENRSRSVKVFEARPEAEAFIANLKPVILIDGWLRYVGDYITTAEAETAARDLTKREAKGGDLRGMNIAEAERVGPARRAADENVTAQRFMDEFGFRGVNFGREGWINQEERQAYLDHAYDALADLAEILGVPPRALSLNGMLGIAFGAQGRGGFAAAHFIPGVNEINLTKTKGAGTLSHEWGHALDHYFATLGGLSKETDPFVSEHADRKEFGADLRPEIVARFKTVVGAMKQRPMTEEEAQQQAAGRRDIALKSLEGWLRAFRNMLADARDKEHVFAEFDQLADRLRRGDMGEGHVKSGNLELRPVIAQIRNLVKDATGRMSSADDVRALDANAGYLRYLVSEKESTTLHTPQTTSTKYRSESLRADQEKGGKRYWATEHEMFARAFETYVADKLAELAQRNTFLSDAAMRAEMRNREGTGYAMPYPREAERKAINEAIDKLIATIETKETEKGVAMLSRAGLEQFALTRKIGKKGLPIFGSREIALLDPVGTVLGQESLVDFQIYDTQEALRLKAAGESTAGAQVGIINLSLDPATGQILALNNILIDPEKQAAARRGAGAEPLRYGERVVRAIVASLPEGAGLKINQILPGAVEFWRKLGVRLERGIILYNGILTRQDYEQARGQDFGQSTRPDRVAGVGAEGAEEAPGAGEAQGDRGRPPGARESRAAGGELAELLESPATAGLRVSEARKFIARVAERIAVPIDLHDGPAALSSAIGVELPSDTRGAFHARRIHLALSNIRDIADLQVVLWHEIFHAGFNVLATEWSFPYQKALDEIAARNKNIRTRAAAWRVSFWKDFAELLRDRGINGQKAIERMTQLRSYEEALADLSGANVEIAGVKDFITALQKLLRALGLDALADWMETRTNSEALTLIRRARDAVTRPEQSSILTTQKSPAWQTTVGVRFPEVGPTARGSSQIILTERDIVKLVRFSRAVPAPTSEQRAEALLAKPRGTAPLDKLFRATTTALGIPVVTKAVGRKLGEWTDRWVPESVKSGVVSDYGLPEAVVDRRDAMFAHIRQQIRSTGTILDKLATLTREESRVAYEWMSNRNADALLARLPQESRETLTGMKQWIEDLSKEAVRLRQLSDDAYQRNTMAYLHRSYRRYEMDQTRFEKASRARVTRVLGEQYKGRGIFDAVDMDRIRAPNPAWWERKLKQGKADVALKGEKFIRLEKRASRGEGVAVLPGMLDTSQKGKLLGVVYWPAELAVPSTLADHEQAGIWEVRGVKRDRVIMWRDFTREERTRMGELDEVRFAFGKTMQQMVHDIEVGRHLEWLANTQARPEAPDDAEVEEASELLRKVYKPGSWVKVPDSEIPKTGGVKKYGKLAGLYVPGPVWNDIRQVVNYRYQPLGETYAKILRAWKISKALALDTPIPTPSGWTTMGALVPGDTVFNEKGQPCTVLQATEAQHNHQCYEVQFSDGTKIIADAGHLWFTLYRGNPGVRETREIVETLKEHTRGDNNHSIPVAGALALPEVELLVPPYALGLWLGDGRRDGARMSVGGENADEIMLHLTVAGVECGPSRKDSRNNVVYFQLMTPGVNGKMDGRRRGEAVQAKLRALGVLGDKHIPAVYLRASEAQRQELLMGLMDSDGHITERGLCGFCTTDSALKDGVLELLRSLGYKPTAKLYETRCNGKPATPAWHLHFKSYADRPVFKLARKVARLQAPTETPQRSRTRQIVAVREVPSVPVRCILVSSPSHLFLAGEGMVPTHNTALSPTVHMNNVMANVIMADWHDVTGAHVLAALKVMMNKNESANKRIMERFEDAGGLQGMYVITELQREQLRPLLEALEREINRVDGITGVVNAANFLQLFFTGHLRQAWASIEQSRPAGLVKGGARALMDLYQFEDTVFRMAAFLKAKSEGLSDVAAGKFARRSFMDYQINAPWINIMRNTTFPFIAFTYRALPMLWDTAVNRPWKLMKLAVILGTLNALGYALSGGDEDEERRLLPEEKAGRVLGFLTPKLVRMPWNDEHGSPVFLDIRRFIPLGDIVDFGSGHAAVPMLPATMPGGPLMALAEILLNKKGFTDTPITKRTDTPAEVTGKLIEYVYQTFAPNLPILPYTYSTLGWWRSGTGQVDAFGRELSLGQALASSVGWKVASYPKDEMLRRAQGALQSKEREISENIGGLRRQYQRGGLSREELLEQTRRQEQKREGLRRLHREKVTGQQ